MKTIEELEIYAKNNYVPISRKDAILYLKEIVLKYDYQTILEIGTAIAYTSIILASINNKIKVTTIEKDENMFNIANTNIEDFNLKSQINIIYGDALEISLNNKFDLIYIDAAKSKNIDFVEKFSPLLNKKGLIIVDNMLLKDLSDNANKKKVDKLLAKIEKFKEYLNNNPKYQVNYVNIGDGFALIKVL